MVTRLHAFALATALSLPAAGIAAPPATIDLHLSADVTVDVDGRIQSLQWTEQQGLQAAVAQRIEGAIRGWEFEPGKVNGKAAETRTALGVHVVASDTPDGRVLLRFAKAATGPRKTAMVPPRYPEAGVRAGVSAKVVMTVDVAADGSVTVAESRFEGSKGTRGRAAFLQATEKAVQAWTFRPETVGGHGVASRVEVPVTFCLSSSRWCEQQAESADARLAVPSGTPVALDSAVALKTDIRAQQI